MDAIRKERITPVNPRNDVVEIRWHGRGGQGVVTAGELLAHAAMNEQKYFQSFPEFGAERSGAPVAAYARLSSEPIDVQSAVTEHCGCAGFDASGVGWYLPGPASAFRLGHGKFSPPSRGNTNQFLPAGLAGLHGGCHSNSRGPSVAKSPKRSHAGSPGPGHRVGIRKRNDAGDSGKAGQEPSRETDSGTHPRQPNGF